MQIQIIHLTRETATCLKSVAVDVFDADITPAWLDAYLSAPNHAQFVATVDGVVVGQARGIVQHQPDGPLSLFIDNLGVTPDMRRQGIATRLVKALIGWGEANGCQTSWVAAETDNDAARRFYESFGFNSRPVTYYFTGPDEPE